MERKNATKLGKMSSIASVKFTFPMHKNIEIYSLLASAGVTVDLPDN